MFKLIDLRFLSIKLNTSVFKYTENRLIKVLIESKLLNHFLPANDNIHDLKRNAYSQ